MAELGATLAQPIRIVYVIDSLRLGGAERHLVRLLEQMTRSGQWRPSVYCLDRRGPLIEEVESLGIDVVGPDGDWSKSLRSALRTFCFLLSYLTREKPAIVHCYLPTAGFIGTLAARLAGTPYVITTRRTVHSYAGRRFVRYWMVRAIMDRWSDAVVAVCEAARLQALREGTPARKLVTVHNAVEPVTSHVGARNRHHPGQLLFGSVGSLHPDKGHRYLIEAAPQVLAALPQARFVLAGDGPERSALEARVLQLDIGPYVEFLGSRRDIPQILPRFDVFVLPSLREGLPNAVLEAMAWGLPVVATRVGGVPEVVAAGETGLLVAPGAPDELAQAMITLGTDAAQRVRFGNAARATIASRFSPEREFGETEALYARLLGERGEQEGCSVALAGNDR